MTVHLQQKFTFTTKHQQAFYKNDYEENKNTKVCLFFVIKHSVV